MGIRKDVEDLGKEQEKLRQVRPADAMVDKTTAGYRIKPKAKTTTQTTTDTTIPRWG